MEPPDPGSPAAGGTGPSAACLAVLDMAIAEREDRRPAPDLVWAGPEAPIGTARDTAVALRSARSSDTSSALVPGARVATRRASGAGSREPSSPRTSTSAPRASDTRSTPG